MKLHIRAGSLNREADANDTAANTADSTDSKKHGSLNHFLKSPKNRKILQTKMNYFQQN